METEEDCEGSRGSTAETAIACEIVYQSRGEENVNITTYVPTEEVMEQGNIPKVSHDLNALNAFQDGNTSIEERGWFSSGGNSDAESQSAVVGPHAGDKDKSFLSKKFGPNEEVDLCVSPITFDSACRRIVLSKPRNNEPTPKKKN